MIFEHTNKINGITVNWTDGTENEGRKIVSVDSGSGPQPVNVPIPEAMQALPDIAESLFEIGFIPVAYKQTIGARDAAGILGLSIPQVIRLIKKLGISEAYQNSAGWQIPWSALVKFRNRPERGRPVEFLK